MSQTEPILLEKHIDTYKLIIPLNVEKKIRYLCNKITTVEWSGTLFYKYSGTYEDGTLEIECVDIFPMDIGSATYTEFDMSPDVIAYMTDHPELLDCQVGLIHSHNNMATFLSGTDLTTLKEEGRDRNHFVSLIVNNEGTYTAAITRKLLRKNVVNTTYTYKTFDDIEKSGTSFNEVAEKVIVYNMLNIIKEETTDSFSEIDERLAFIRENKQKPVIEQKSGTSYYFDSDNQLPFPKSNYYNENKNYISQPSLFDNKNQTFCEDFYMESSPIRRMGEEMIFKESDIDSIVLQLITGSIVISNTSKIDPIKWAGQMESLFDKRFNKDMGDFQLWAEMLTEFVLTSFCSKYGEVSDRYYSELSTAVYTALDELPSNKYIKEIQNALTLWMK